MRSKEPPAGISPELWEQWTSGSGYDYSKLEPVPEPATLRDQFAMAALATLESRLLTPAGIANRAYRIADEMLEARKQETPT